jgi:hypothetical protein
MRFDLYSVVHKAQRKNLYELSVKIGRADFQDATQVTAIKGEIKTLLTRLRKHAHHEETFVHPLFHQIGTHGNTIEAEHRDLELIFEALEKCLDTENQSELYTRFNRFLTAYLTHIDAEETAQKDILWKHYDDAALLEVMKKFNANRTLDESLEDLEYMFPSLSPQEIQGILGSMKGSVPNTVYETVSAMAQKASL